ncbi:MAG: hypothetical protein MUF10_14795 [Thermoanaerobaculaceae bacterium]|jgi:hypothetical protein|nr:hypothetical protein [Thermoanaerobaculaceae bacterium]
MDVILMVLYAVIAGSLTLVLILNARRLLARRLMPRASWVKRSGRDRRVRNVPVLVDRRRGSRREEDISRAYLASLGK